MPSRQRLVAKVQFYIEESALTNYRRPRARCRGFGSAGDVMSEGESTDEQRLNTAAKTRQLMVEVAKRLEDDGWLLPAARVSTAIDALDSELSESQNRA
jgi:hypothetical protein